MIDLTSATWAAVKKHCNDELTSARAKLEHDLDEKETARLRAYIRALKGVLSLGDPKPEIPSDGNYT